MGSQLGFFVPGEPSAGDTLRKPRGTILKIGRNRICARRTIESMISFLVDRIVITSTPGRDKKTPQFLVVDVLDGG